MCRVTWDRTLETGDPAVDFQHRELLAMFDDLSEAIVERHGHAAVGLVLDRLSAYLMVHLETERRLMVRTALDRDEMRYHLAEHDELTARTRGLILEHREGAGDSVGLVAANLREWFCEHIAQWDCGLVAHLHSIDRR